MQPFSSEFPKLKDVHQKKTSDEDPKYNCIAWAFEDNLNFWWPSRRGYWPLSHEGLSCLQAFEQLFREWGWERTENQSLEKGYKKIALYIMNGEPTHAARLMENGMWTSKLGVNIDLSHELEELEGPVYGSIFCIYQKPACPPKL